MTDHHALAPDGGVEVNAPDLDDGCLSPNLRETIWVAVHSAQCGGTAPEVTEATVRICEAVLHYIERLALTEEYATTSAEFHAGTAACPFCQHGYRDEVYKSVSGQRWYQVRCCGCGARGPSERTSDDCVNSWNRHVSVATLATQQPSAAEPWWTDAGSVKEARRVFQEGRAALLRERDRNTHLKGVYEPAIAALEPMLSTLAHLDTKPSAAGREEVAQVLREHGIEPRGRSTQVIDAILALARSQRDAEVEALREALKAMLALKITSISRADAGARNGKELIRAHAIARAALSPSKGGPDHG